MLTLSQWVAKVREAALVDLERFYNEMGPQMALEVGRVLGEQAIAGVRAAEYLGQRAYGAQHRRAVRAQNMAAGKVREALGYAYPKDDFWF